MSKNNYPKESCNAVSIVSTTEKENLILMEKLKKTFDFFSEEPITISIKKEENSRKEVFTCILRIRVWGKNKNFSWNIFSKDRELFRDLIIRKVVWDHDKDTKILKKSYKNNLMISTKDIPSANIRNIYIPSTKAKDIISIINQLEAEIGEGFILKKKHDSKSKWREIEILRLYDWGQVHYRWENNRKNKKVYKRMKDLVLKIDKLLEKSYENIFEMTLDYYNEDPEKFSSENLLRVWEE